MESSKDADQTWRHVTHTNVHIDTYLDASRDARRDAVPLLDIINVLLLLLYSAAASFSLAESARRYDNHRLLPTNLSKVRLSTAAAAAASAKKPTHFQARTI